MTTLAAVHVAPAYTVPVAVLIAALLVWYWRTLGRPGVPPLRRRVRRISLGIMLLSLPNFVRGLSFLDPTVDQAQYVVSWSASMVLILLIFATACADALVTVSLQRRQHEREIAEGGADLIEAIRKHQDEA